MAIADEAGALTGVEVLRDREAQFGPVASMPTAWRLLDRIDEVHPEWVRAAREPGLGGGNAARSRR